MKITVYTITTCQFSKQEREYLASHGLQYEEKNLEMNREFLSEMLTVGSNFAGTPVTKIEKDDGQIVVLKGFTKEEFDKTFGFAADAPKQDPAQATQAAPAQSTESAQATPQQPAPMPTEQVAQPAVAQPPVAQQPSPAPVAPADPAMASILTNLEQKAATPAQPTIPDPQF